MESTGVYWKSVYHVLGGTVEVLIGNPHEMRRRPGQKTDPADARWIAALFAHGLIRPSFIPPPPLRALRDLTRARIALVQTRSQTKNRKFPLALETGANRGRSGLLPPGMRRWRQYVPPGRFAFRDRPRAPHRPLYTACADPGYGAGRALPPGGHPACHPSAPDHGGRGSGV